MFCFGLFCFFYETSFAEKALGCRTLETSRSTGTGGPPGQTRREGGHFVKHKNIFLSLEPAAGGQQSANFSGRKQHFLSWHQTFLCPTFSSRTGRPSRRRRSPSCPSPWRTLAVLYPTAAALESSAVVFFSFFLFFLPVFVPSLCSRRRIFSNTVLMRLSGGTVAEQTRGGGGDG